MPGHHTLTSTKYKPEKGPDGKLIQVRKQTSSKHYQYPKSPERSPCKSRSGRKGERQSDRRQQQPKYEDADVEDPGRRDRRAERKHKDIRSPTSQKKGARDQQHRQAASQELERKNQKVAPRPIEPSKKPVPRSPSSSPGSDSESEDDDAVAPPHAPGTSNEKYVQDIDRRPGRADVSRTGQVRDATRSGAVAANERAQNQPKVVDSQPRRMPTEPASPREA